MIKQTDSYVKFKAMDKTAQKKNATGQAMEIKNLRIDNAEYNQIRYSIRNLATLFESRDCQLSKKEIWAIKLMYSVSHNKTK